MGVKFTVVISSVPGLNKAPRLQPATGDEFESQFNLVQPALSSVLCAEHVERLSLQMFVSRLFLCSCFLCLCSSCAVLVLAPDSFFVSLQLFVFSLSLHL